MRASSPFRGSVLQGFSTATADKMYGNCPGCPHKTYMRFVSYYGDYDYADKWVSAALAGTNMTFSNGYHGPNNFAVLGEEARIEAVKKGTAYMNVWMFVVSEFEEAIAVCTDKGIGHDHDTNHQSVHAWDEGVAFYTGSLEGTAYGGNSDGKLLLPALKPQT